MYTKEFKEFVEQGVNQQYFVGTGNPNAHILIVGKESAISANDTGSHSWYKKNAETWLKHIKNSTCEPLSYPVKEDHVFRKEKSWGKNTWSKYQKLTNYILDKEVKPYHIDFLEDVFTTEINDAPSKKTSEADKSKLNERKALFKESNFIQSFPVVILACSNYIRNSGRFREIDEIFRVSYKDEFPKEKYSRTNWFFSHYNEDKTRLVIHTRQLSTNVHDNLLKDMGALIAQHLTKHNLKKSTLPTTLV